MKANLVANVYYWLGYIISDIEQVDGYSGLRGKIDELRDAINDLIHGRGGRMKLKWQQKNDKECYSYVFGTPLMCVVYHEDGKTARELQLEKETNAKLTARWIEGGYGQMLAFRGNGTIEYKTARSMLKAYADQAIDTFAEKALVEGQGAVILEVRIVPQIPAPEKP